MLAPSVSISTQRVMPDRSPKPKKIGRRIQKLAKSLPKSNAPRASGAITSTDRIRLTTMGNGIGLGMITGMIAFAVLFVPMMLTIFPKEMVTILEMMNPGIPEQDIMKNIEASMPMIINNSILVHIIFGAVLGAVTTAILRKVSVYKCNQCRTMMTDEKRYREHMKQHFVVHTDNSTAQN